MNNTLKSSIIRYLFSFHLLKKDLHNTLTLSMFLGALLGLFQYGGSFNDGVLFSRKFFLLNPNYSALNGIIIVMVPLFISLIVTKPLFDEIDLQTTLYSKINYGNHQMLRFLIVFVHAFLMMFVFLLSNFFVLFLSGNYRDIHNIEIYDSEITGFINNDTPFYSLHINAPTQYLILQMCLVGLWGAMNGVFAYSIAALTKNRIAAYLIPFLMFITVVVISGLFKNGITAWNPDNIYLPFPRSATNPGVFSLELGMVILFLLYAGISFGLLLIAIAKDRGDY